MEKSTKQQVLDECRRICKRKGVVYDLEMSGLALSDVGEDADDELYLLQGDFIAYYLYDGLDDNDKAWSFAYGRLGIAVKNELQDLKELNQLLVKAGNVFRDEANKLKEGMKALLECADDVLKWEINSRGHNLHRMRLQMHAERLSPLVSEWKAYLNPPEKREA